MQVKQSIIAFIFLAIFSLGFGHGVVPHCEGKEAGGEDHHHHKHHEHSSDNPIDDYHVSHNNHLDENIYDYLVCLVSDLEHEDDNCNMFLCSNITLNDFSFIDLVKVELPLVHISSFNLELLNNSESDYAELDCISGLPPILENILHRGPPSISC